MAEQGYPGHVEPADFFSVVKRASWGAIFAGLFIALAIQLLLTTLGAAVGMTAFSFGGTHRPEAAGIGAAVWLPISAIIALFVGGWVAGRLSGAVRAGDAVLHGFVVWGFSAVVVAYLATTALGDFLGATAMSAALAENAPGVRARPQIHGEPISRYPSTQPAAATQPAGTVGEFTREAVGEMTRNPAGTAERATGYLAGASWWTFFTLLLSGIASLLGGWAGAPGAYVTRTRTTGTTPPGPAR